MRLAIGLNFYNDVAGLDRLLKSIPSRGVVDCIIGVDGIYQYTKEQNLDLPYLSNDGSRELLKRSRFDVHLLNCAGQPEYIKRNRYLEYASKIGVTHLIIVDSDEYFLIEDLNCSCLRKRQKAWNKFKNDWHNLVEYHDKRYNVYTMTMYDPVTKKKSLRPRCWYNPGDMRYLGGSHYHWGNIVTEAKQIEQHQQQKAMYTQSSIDNIPFTDLVLVNDQSIRTKEVNDRRELYQKYLIKYESLRQTNLNLEHQQAHELASQMLVEPAAAAAAATELLLQQLNEKKR